MANRNFREMLEAKWAEGKFVCVGLDSEYQRIPETVRQRYMHSVRGSIFEFNAAIVDATKDIASSYKLNLGFYCGGARTVALRETVIHIHAATPKTPVVLNWKGGDPLHHVNRAYAEHFFGDIGADAITVNPYPSGEAFKPFLDWKEKGIIVLCRTSNLGAGEFQNQKIVLTFDELANLVGDADEANDLNGKCGWSYPTGGYRMPTYQYVALRVSRHWNKNGNCGLVVGATYSNELRQIREIVGDMPILIPGIGAQGGDVEAVVQAGKDSRGRGMIINSSRGIIFASSGPDFAEAAHRETLKLHEAISDALQKGVSQ